MGTVRVPGGPAHTDASCGGRGTEAGSRRTGGGGRHPTPPWGTWVSLIVSSCPCTGSHGGAALSCGLPARSLRNVLEGVLTDIIREDTHLSDHP